MSNPVLVLLVLMCNRKSLFHVFLLALTDQHPKYKVIVEYRK